MPHPEPDLVKCNQKYFYKNISIDKSICKMDAGICGWDEFSQACHSLIDMVIVSVTLIGNITYLFWQHTSHVK